MKQILIIDDVATNLRLVSGVLGEQYKVLAAKSGEQGLKVLKTETPDLILLDIGMPGMDGYEVMELLKQDPKTADIPVVFLTADTDRETEAKSLQMGAMDFIRKPFEPQILLGRVENILNMELAKKNGDAAAEDTEKGRAAKLVLFYLKARSETVDSYMLENAMGALMMAVRMQMESGDLMAEISEKTLMAVKYVPGYEQLEEFAQKVLKAYRSAASDDVAVIYEVKQLFVG